VINGARDGHVGDTFGMGAGGEVVQQIGGDGRLVS
jgi:hypothetical protein